MSLAGLLGALVLTALVLAFIAAPFLRRSKGPDRRAATDLQRERVLAYYERVLRNVRDLDEDYALGKLDEADYQHDRATWTERGVQALKLLDQLDAGSAGVSASSDAAELDAAVERAVKAAVEQIQASQETEGTR
ncbi:MAG: hypothetical protein U0452_03655 [Anaerolineae bacterium]